MLDEIKFTLKGNPATKKNSSQITTIYSRSKGRRVPILVPSQRYSAYRKDCLFQLQKIIKEKAIKTIDYPINLQCVYYREDFVMVDISNLINATHDILEDAGVIADDNWSVVNSVDGSRVFFDPLDPRVEVTITKVKDKRTSISSYKYAKRLRELESVIKTEKRLDYERLMKFKNQKKIYKLRTQDRLTWGKVAKEVGLSVSTVSIYFKEYIKETIKDEIKDGISLDDLSKKYNVSVEFIENNYILDDIDSKE